MTGKTARAEVKIFEPGSNPIPADFSREVPRQFGLKFLLKKQSAHF